MTVHHTNDPIDARAQAAADGLISSFADLDTEAALDTALSESNVSTRHESRAGRTRWIGVAAAVVLVIGGTVAIAATRSRSTHDPVPAISPPPPTPAVTITAAPASTVTTDRASTTTPSTTDTPTTTVAEPPASAAIAVSYLNPPPVLPIQPLGAAVTVPGELDGSFAVAIGDLGVAVSQWTYRGTDPTRIDVIGFDGLPRIVDSVDGGAMVAYGPDDIAYLTRQGNSIDDFAVVAVPLSGPNAGATVATQSANVNQFLEYPPLSFGHGADGVIHRRDYLAGSVVMPYVDSDGQPTTVDSSPATFQFGSVDDAGRGLGGTITSSNGTSWTLAVEAAAVRGSTAVGISPPAPGIDERGVYVTHIGPSANPGADFGEPTMWVVAELKPDGTATWWSLPDGWQILASDSTGTVVGRHTGTRLELALAEFGPSPICPDEPTFEPTTLPDGVAAELLAGDGAQITITPDGEVEPVEPINPSVFHYAGPPGVFINIGAGATRALDGPNTETIVVFGQPATLTEIEDGYKAEINPTCGTYTLVSSGISLDDFRTFLEGLRE